MSDEDHLDLKETDVYPTGFYLNELMQPVKMFIDAGHDVTFATPNGGAPPLDKVSENVMFFSNEETLVELRDAVVADPNWTYAGYNMTVFSNKEELAAQGWLAGGEMKFHPQDALKLAGGQYSESTELWHPNGVVNRELITGHNPAPVAVASATLEKLK